MDTDFTKIHLGVKFNYQGVDYQCRYDGTISVLISIDLSTQQEKLAHFHLPDAIEPIDSACFVFTPEFKRQHLQRRAGRLCAKLALSHLNSRSPAQQHISISQSPESLGKPCSPDGYISISHNGKWAIAMASHAPVGIDIQKKKTFGESALMAVFRPEECLNATDDELTQIWCVKEAYLKMLGRGLLPYAKNVHVVHNTDDIWNVTDMNKQSNKTTIMPPYHHVVHCSDWDEQKYVMAACLMK